MEVLMKTVIALAIALTSFATLARETVSFSHSGLEGWGVSYYSCDYVEARTEQVLEMFGATQVQVDCSGGIEFGRMSPVMVTASFEAPALVGTEVAQTVKYRGDVWNPSCGINVKIVKSVLPKFSNVTVVKKSDSCAFQNTNYSYEFSIVK
jgi:hypothetical protein